MVTEVDITTAEQLKVFFDHLCNREYSNLLDIGCGKDSKLIKDIKCNNRTGIEVFEPYFDQTKSTKFYQTLMFGDVRNIISNFRDNTFDLVLAIDFIEHLDKQTGKSILKEIERVAARQIMLFTPYKFYHQDPYEENPYQEHKSGWEPDDFEGYNVYLLPKMHGTGAMVINKSR